MVWGVDERGVVRRRKGREGNFFLLLVFWGGAKRIWWGLVFDGRC